MKRRTLPFLFVLSVVLTASPVFAQARWTVEFRGGGNVTTEQFASVDLEPRVGLEGGVGLRVAPALFVYGAWDWQQHRSKTRLFGAIADVEDTGYAFGLRYVAPVASRAKPWVRAGGLYNHVEIEDSNAGSMVADSEHTFGFEVGGGLDIALDDAWSVTPGVRYRRFEPDVRRGGIQSPATLSYITYDVGLMLKF